MSIVETVHPKPARKPKRRAKRAVPAAPKAVKPAAGLYAGLSVHDCCSGCSAEGCVISGKPYCAHPRKGGLHAAEQQDEAALKRRRDAERVIGKQKLVVE